MPRGRRDTGQYGGAWARQHAPRRDVGGAVPADVHGADPTRSASDDERWWRQRPAVPGQAIDAIDRVVADRMGVEDEPSRGAELAEGGRLAPADEVVAVGELLVAALEVRYQRRNVLVLRNHGRRL